MKASWAKRRASKPSLVETIQFGKPSEATDALAAVVKEIQFSEPPLVSALAHDIMSLSRKPGGIAQIDNTLKAMELTARYEGERRAEESFARKSAEEMRAIDEAIVGSFLAELAAHPLEQGGVFTVSTFVLTRIVGALKRAGYSPTGRNNINRVTESRDAVMNKTHADSDSWRK
jgi:hypothetical protein